MIYAERRAALMEQMESAVALFFAAPELIRNRDVPQPYRQESDFYYLTGFTEPEAVLLLAPNQPEGAQEVLFLRERDQEKEVWLGERLGIERAVESLEIEKPLPISSLEQELPELLKGAAQIYFDLGRHGPDDQIVIQAMRAARSLRREGAETPHTIIDSAELLHEMRLFKGPAELEILRRSASLTALGHRRAMAATTPGLYEYQLQALMEYEWHLRGSERVAYGSIVGGGKNACCLHYEENRALLSEGALVLVDAACELDYYAADITRTWPVSGHFNEVQARLYSYVLKAQKAAIAACREGKPFNGVHDASVRVLTEALIELELIDGPLEEAISDERHKKYSLHRCSHWLGLDVHDVGRYHLEGESRPLKPGMLLTVEPGLYIPADDEHAPESMRGLGIRIEDDVLITEGEPEILTWEAPKEIAEIEALVGSTTLELS